MGRLSAINAFDSSGVLVGTCRALGHIRQPAVLALEIDSIAHSETPQPHGKKLRKKSDGRIDKHHKLGTKGKSFRD
jgi:hypothetical protein